MIKTKETVASRREGGTAMRRPVSNSNPPLQFNLSVADFETQITRLPTVLRCVFRGETRPNATWTGVNMDFGDQWDEQTRTLTIVMSHNGPVDVTIESGESCPRCAGSAAGKENAK